MRWARLNGKFGGSGPVNFAVRPYPSQLQRHIEAKDGWRVFVRPIKPEDEPQRTSGKHDHARNVPGPRLRDQDRSGWSRHLRCAAEVV